MSYCQGTLGASDPSAGVTRNVTECSHRKMLFSFDPTQEWPEVSHGPELEWPRVISDDFHAFRMTTRSMAVLYCIGVGAMGAALIVRVWTAVAPRAGQGSIECGLMVVSATCSGSRRHGWVNDPGMSVLAGVPRIPRIRPWLTLYGDFCSSDLSVLVSHRLLRRSWRWNLWR